MSKKSKKGKKTKRPKLHKRAWVRVDFESLHPSVLPHYEKHRDKRYIYLGPIPNQPGHCLVLDPGKQDTSPAGFGLNIIVFHTDDLIELSCDET